MFKFFRQIRQNLLKNGKNRQYVKYAFGEVLLVVVGILIALQINNWNEKKKEKAFEKKVLKEILTDTEEDLDEMKNALESLTTKQQSCDILLDIINKNRTGILKFEGQLVNWKKAVFSKGGINPAFPTTPLVSQSPQKVPGNKEDL